MSAIRVWETPGGIHPPENKTQSLQLPLAECSLAEEFILPLNQHIGAPATPIVSVGESVKKYQCIAKGEGIFSAAVHAPTSGTVTAIEERLIAHPSGMSAMCIVISADGQDDAIALTPCDEPFALEHNEIVERIRAAGIAGMGGAGFPTAVKLNPKANTQINTLIINGTECEPYITADDMLMQTHANEVVAGTQLLAHTLNQPARVVIGVEDNKPQAIAALQDAARHTNIEVVSFPTKYPSGGEKQLIYILTGQEVASGALPSSLGIVVQNVGTTVAAWRAVRFGEPLIERITTVVGEALGRQRNMRVRIGTPVDHVLAENGFKAAQSPRLIVGGPMMGFAIEQTQVPVVKTTNCLIAPSHHEMPEAPPQQACIRCGHCAEVCPAGLLPQQLYWYAKADEHEKLQNHNLFDCIECGACSYVCPSSIPLVQYYRNAKGTIRQAEIDKQKADRARERFERRQERIEKVEAAKEAKRLARKAAAEKNKAKLAAQANATKPEDASASNTADATSTVGKTASNADKTTNNASKTNSAADDIVAKAIAAAKAQQTETTPEQEKARLTRTLESLQSRVERTQQQINEAIADGKDESRVETLKAKLKQTELKVADTEKKIAALQLAPATKEQTATTDVDASAQQEKAIRSLEKRLATAREKLQEAERDQKPTVEALRSGVAKLEQKIADSQAELAKLKAGDTSTNAKSASSQANSHDAAAAAIERAKQKAQAAASMSPEEKRAAAIASTEKRLAKARERLAKATAENDENLEAFATSVEKLEKKLQDAQAE